MFTFSEHSRSAMIRIFLPIAFGLAALLASGPPVQGVPLVSEKRVITVDLAHGAVIVLQDQDTTLTFQEEDEEGEEEEVIRRKRGDIVKFGQDIVIEEDQRVGGDVVAIGGSILVAGEVSGDVVAVGGSIHVLEKGRVEGDAVAVGGTIRKEKGASIEGDEAEVGVAIPGLHLPRLPFFQRLGLFPSLQIGRLFLSLFLLLVVALLGSGLIILFPRHLEIVGQTISRNFFKAGVVGLLAQILFIPGIVVLCVLLLISIVGIPLLLAVPLVILLFLVGHFFGYIAVALLAGRAVLRGNLAGRSPYLMMAVGLLLIVGVTLLGRVVGIFGGFLHPVALLLVFSGAMIRYLAWTIGLGGVILSRFGTRLPLVPAVVSTPPPPVETQG